MSTLADELLNDFEDSGSEGEPETENGGLFPEADGHAPTTNGNRESMELDGDEEDVSEDEDMTGAGIAIDALDDEEATKAKVEKMQLGGVDDVRSVAGLMKTLEPVLEVSTFSFPAPFSEQRFTSPICTSPDIFRAPTEDIIFPEPTAGPADDAHRLD